MAEMRQGAITRALAYFDDGGFAEELARRVAIASVSVEDDKFPELHRYLDEEIIASLEALGFSCRKFDNSYPGIGPILVAERIEDAAAPTVLSYGHGDVVRGLDELWDDGLSPWKLVRQGDALYGRGTADNKGQHTINLAALRAVLEERGRLGFNVKFVMETAEERGSRGFHEFCESHGDLLAADVMIASDGPRLQPDEANLSIGNRGAFHFRLEVNLRPGGLHSGHWGGILEDPAIIIAHAIASITEARGRIRIAEWVPSEVPQAVRDLLADIVVESGEGAPVIAEDWGEPDIGQIEKMFAWSSFIVLASQSGNPDNPVNAVSPNATAWCQLRHTVDVDRERLEPALREHLDRNGFPMVEIIPDWVRSRPAARTDPEDPWVIWAARSLTETTGRKPKISPNTPGGLPSDAFLDLGIPTIWVPHSYRGCCQHGPNEHLLMAPAREGLGVMAGLFWDLGENPPPRASPS